MEDCNGNNEAFYSETFFIIHLSLYDGIHNQIIHIHNSQLFEYHEECTN
jgi:hypothetical protein